MTVNLDADSSDNSDSENVESDDPEITFNQWSSTDRAELIKQTTSLSDFIELFLKTSTRLLFILSLQKPKVAI